MPALGNFSRTRFQKSSARFASIRLIVSAGKDCTVADSNGIVPAAAEIAPAASELCPGLRPKLPFKSLKNVV